MLIRTKSGKNVKVEAAGRDFLVRIPDGFGGEFVDGFKSFDEALRWAEDRQPEQVRKAVASATDLASREDI